MPSEFDSRTFRNAVGMFATGVTVVTSGKAPNFHGMTANAFSSLSLDPPLILVCVDKGTHMLAVLEETRAFTVNILSAEQEELSTYFATSGRPHGPEEFAKVPYSLGETDAPRIDGALCVLDCVLHSVAPGGDHDIYVGEVKALAVRPDTQPILFYAGAYGALQQASDDR